MHCRHCGKENIVTANFCIACGKKLKGENAIDAKAGKSYFAETIILFVSIVLVIVFSTAEYDNLPLLTHEYVFSGLLLLITLVYILFDPKGFFCLFRIKPRLKPFIYITLAAPLLALMVIMLADLINSVFGFEQTAYYVDYLLNTSNMYLYGILCVAVLPGFIEEMLFRGILFNYLLKFTRPKIVILISSLLFAFVHFSVHQGL